MDFRDRQIIKIENWLNHEITEQEAEILQKDDEYYTEWLDTIIFDKDKYTCKEMLRFVWEKEPPQEKSNFIIWLILWIVLFIILAVVFYNNMTSSVKQKTTTSEVQTINTKLVVNESEKWKLVDTSIPIIDQNYENKKEWKEEIIATQENVITQDNELLLIDKLNYEIETTRFNFDKIMDQKNNLKSENIELLEINKNLWSENEFLLSENKELKLKLDSLERSILWDSTNLEKFLWSKVFATCKDSDNKTCKQLFDYFYKNE